MLERLQYNQQLSRHGLSKLQKTIPKALNLIHRYLACTCIMTIGLKALNFSEKHVLEKFNKTEMKTKEKKQQLKQPK